MRSLRMRARHEGIDTPLTTLSVARVAIIIVMFAGAWLSSQEIFQFSIKYTALLLVSAFSSLVVVARLRRYPSHMQLWIVFAMLLLGYNLKLPLLQLVEAAAPARLVTPWSSIGGIEPAILLKAYEVASVSLVLLALIVVAVTSTRWRDGIAGAEEVSSDRSRRIDNLTAPAVDVLRPSSYSSHPKVVLSNATLWVWCGAGLSALTIGLQAWLGFGVASSEASAVVVLPYRLGGVLQGIRGELVPMLLLFLVWATDISERPMARRASVAACLSHGLISSFISATKGPLLLAIIGIFMLWAIQNRLTRSRKIWLACVTVAALGVFAVIAEVRMAVSSQRIGLLPALEQIIGEMRSIEDFADLFTKGFASIVSRLNGIDSLAEVIRADHDLSPGQLYSMLVEQRLDLNYIYATDILGVDDLGLGAFSVSLVGLFYMITNNTFATAILLAIAALSCHALGVKVLRIGLISSPVILTSLSLLTAQFISEGSVQALPILLLKWTLWVVLIEGFAQSVLRTYSKNRRPDIVVTAGRSI